MNFVKTRNESVNLFRKLALEIDKNPSAISQHLDAPIFEKLCLDQVSTCLERTQLMETLSYGDAGVSLAAPGPSLAGLMLRELGLPEQIDAFYSKLSEESMHTFFALTEPNKGSDASGIETKLTSCHGNSQKFLLNGVKCFFGNG